MRPRPVDFRPNSPNATVLPRCARPRPLRRQLPGQLRRGDGGHGRRPDRETGLRANEIAFFTLARRLWRRGLRGRHHGAQASRAGERARRGPRPLRAQHTCGGRRPRRGAGRRSAARAVIMVGAYAPCARFIELARDVGLDASFLNVSFVGAAPWPRRWARRATG